MLFLVTYCNPWMLVLELVASVSISSMGKLFQHVGMGQSEQMETWLRSMGTVVNSSEGLSGACAAILLSGKMTCGCPASKSSFREAEWSGTLVTLLLSSYHWT